MNQRYWQDWLIALAGVWILATPWAMEADSGPAAGLTAALSHNALGLAVLVTALSALLAYRPWHELVEMIWGLFVIGTPWLLGFQHSSPWTVSDVVTGVMIMFLSGWKLVGYPQQRV